MYSWALAHLGANDIVDIENDQAKELKTIAGLYGVKGNKIWVHSWSVVHLITSVIFAFFGLGVAAKYGFAVSWILIILANILIIRGKKAKDWLKALPLFHASLLVYILSIIIDSVLMF